VAFKSLIDRLRSKPEWQHDDPAIRAEAVLRLPSTETDLLAQIAREDAHARVRRAAARKLADVALLGRLAKDDADEGVRSEAATRLVALAVHSHEEGQATGALALITEARHLGEAAKLAALETVRRAAVDRITDARILATVVREASDPETKLLALSRIDDSATLASLAQKTDVRAVALAAVERLLEAAALEAVAARGKVPAAAKRARARLAELPGAGEPAAASPLPAPVPASAGDDEAERAAYERERERLLRETAAHDAAVAARVGLCEKLEGVGGSDAREAVEQARTAWASLPDLAGDAAAELQRRFEAAAREAAARQDAFVAAEARRGELEGVLARAEAAVEVSDLEASIAAFEAERTAWTTRATPGATPADLQGRWDTALTKLDARRGEARAAEAQRAADNAARLARLASTLESLAKAGSLSLRDADHAVRDARAALESPGPFPSKREREALLARLEAGKKALLPRLQELREEAEWKRWANVDVQEELCRRAEALREEKDFEKAAAALRDLDARWKQAKEAPKDKAEAFWTRFKAARDEVRSRCDAYFAKKAEELAQNLAKKEDLCVRAEALSESTDWLKSAEALKALQAEWKEVGPTTHATSKAVWERFRKACDRFFVRRDEDRTKRREDWKKNLEQKRELCAKAEALADSSDWDTAAAEIKKLQADWKQVGPVKASDSEAIWQRFRAAADRFFDRYKHRDELADHAAAEAREAICVEAEALLSAEADGLAEKVHALQASWRQAPAVSPRRSEDLVARFQRAIGAVVEAQPAAFAGTDLDPEAALARLEKLCAKAEAALASARPADSTGVSALDLAARLREALAANTMGGQAAAEAKWREATAEVEAARAAFARLGPLPGSRGQELRARFEQACTAFFAARPALSEPAAPAAREDRPRRDRPRGPRPRSEARPRSG
jgi:hypothetical protein